MSLTRAEQLKFLNIIQMTKSVQASGGTPYQLENQLPLYQVSHLLRFLYLIFSQHFILTRSEMNQ